MGEFIFPYMTSCTRNIKQLQTTIMEATTAATRVSDCYMMIDVSFGYSDNSFCQKNRRQTLQMSNCFFFFPAVQRSSVLQSSPQPGNTSQNKSAKKGQCLDKIVEQQLKPFCDAAWNIATVKQQVQDQSGGQLLVR
jgi:hypothetical protein